MNTPMTGTTPALSVTQLTNAIKLCLESTFPSVMVEGEISNLKLQSSGHIYFTLKDANTQIAAVMFRGDASAIKIPPKDGDKVIVRGELNVYPVSGKYQIIVKELQQVGLGELLLRLEELKQKISRRGWFRAEYKKAIPKFPKTIGVVTSPTGAAIHDILKVLKRRFSGFHLILNPVKVQGEGAAQEIAQAIKEFNEYNLVDVMIVGRGGGSIEDLWAFNEEIVAEAIFHSKIPIVCAVGHETDHCIAEYVADMRAPTPSAAAQMVIAEKSQQMEHLAHLQKRLDQSLFQQLRHKQQQLKGILKHPLFCSPYYLLGPYLQRIDSLRQDTDSAIVQNLARWKMAIQSKNSQVQCLKPSTQIANFRQKLNYCERSLLNTITQRIYNTKDHLSKIEIEMGLRIHRLINFKRERLQSRIETLEAINPKKLLEIGYSILFSEKTGSVIKSVHQMKKDDTIRLLLKDGEAVTTVKELFSSD